MANARIDKLILNIILLSAVFTNNFVTCDPMNNDSVRIQKGNIQIQIVNRGSTGRLQPVQQNQDVLGRFKWSSNEQYFGNSEKLVFHNSISGDEDGPPPYEQVAKMARYIVKKSNWTSIATVSTREPTVGFPFANIFSVSDGPIGKSTGIPYLYITALDVSVQDLKKSSRASLTMSLAQGNYCSNNLLDPEDPRCAHVILSGTMMQVKKGSDEEAFAQISMFSRHPVMEQWPSDHGFFFAKLNINSILVLDYFGGAKNVDVKEYYKAAV